MRLDELFAAGEGEVRGVPGAGGEVEIAGLAYDSRAVRQGSLFFCVTGFQRDGRDFAAQALTRGAAALVVERPLGLGAPEVLVASARAAMGPAAVRFYGDPSAELRVVGVTGTNGKTTTAFLLKALLEAADPDSAGCGLIGTVKSVIGGVERTVERTTPEAIDVQADFRAMLDTGDRACAIEVSSHALSLGRADGIHFAAAIFTNISRDHLDFHASMEDYFQAKRRLFAPLAAPSGPDRADGRSSSSPSGPPGVRVVNVGDPYGRRLAAELDGAVTFAVERDTRAGDGHDGGEARDADYRASDVRCDFDGCRFTLHTPAGRSPSAAREVALPMPGRFNVANALGALAAVHALGGDLDTLIAALERGVRVPGRFEPVQAGQEFAVIVDYAHTPDALENVLRAAREIARGRVICVFGAGGDRDRGKRPLMGEVAARLADVVVVTSDNPRSEDPAAIVAEIVAPVAASGEPAPRVELDRRTAIARALALAEADDVVVIAGKGHEQGQELAGGVKLPFDDVTVARDALRARLDGDGELAGPDASGARGARGTTRASAETPAETGE